MTYTEFVLVAINAKLKPYKTYSDKYAELSHIRTESYLYDKTLYAVLTDFLGIEEEDQSTMNRQRLTNDYKNLAKGLPTAVYGLPEIKPTSVKIPKIYNTINEIIEIQPSFQSNADNEDDTIEHVYKYHYNKLKNEENQILKGPPKGNATLYNDGMTGKQLQKHKTFGIYTLPTNEKIPKNYEEITKDMF